MTNYIPGTTLVGCLASTYRLMYPEKTALFEQLFLSGEISFPNLYPATHKRYDGFKEDFNPNLPIYSCLD